MTIKLVATDLDGTLLNSKKEVPTDFKKWVLDHPEIKTVIASGRQYQTIYNDFKECAKNVCFIAENGAFIFEKNKLIYSIPLLFDDVVAIVEPILKCEGVFPLICGKNSAYMPKVKSTAANKEAIMYYANLEIVDDVFEAAKSDVIAKIALFIEDKRAKEFYNSYKVPNDSLCKTISSDSWIDVSSIAAHKGAAIKKLQEMYGISSDECMAFGDYMNDATMLCACTESYCMENGHEDLKAMAKHVASSNDDDGVMKVLRNL